MKKKTKAVAFVSGAFVVNSDYTHVDVSPDLDEDRSGHIYIEGKRPDLYGIHIFRKTDRRTSGNYYFWELVDE
jgi:hypothetical protein